MRPVYPVAFALLSSASTASGQTQVDQSAPSTSEDSAAQAPLPGPVNRNVPSRPDPAATRDVSTTPEPSPVRLRPGAPYQDQLTRHWLVGASVHYASLLGNYSSRVPIGDRLGDALLLGLDLGYGLTSHWELALALDYLDSAAGPSCPECGAVSYGIGPRLRYHLVGGTRFSPWVAYGASYRKTDYDLADGTSTFSELEPIRFELGGNWYVTSNVTIGPVLALGIARSVATDNQGDGRWHVQTSAGLRIALDFIGR